MRLPVLTLPLISRFSALQQSGILALLILISYFHRGARRLFSALILAFVGYKSFVPAVSLCYKIFKFIAMFGFYIHYFQIGVGFIVTGLGSAMVFLETLAQEAREARGTQD